MCVCVCVGGGGGGGGGAEGGGSPGGGGKDFLLHRHYRPSPATNKDILQIW